METILDQQTIRIERIRQNEHLYNIGMLALSTKERTEILASRPHPQDIEQPLDSIDEQAVSVEISHGVLAYA